MKFTHFFCGIFGIVFFLSGFFIISHSELACPNCQFFETCGSVSHNFDCFLLVDFESKTCCILVKFPELFVMFHRIKVFMTECGNLHGATAAYFGF